MIGYINRMTGYISVMDDSATLKEQWRRQEKAKEKRAESKYEQREKLLIKECLGCKLPSKRCNHCGVIEKKRKELISRNGR